MAIFGPQYYQQQIHNAFKKLYQRMSSKEDFQFTAADQKVFMLHIAGILDECKLQASELSLDEPIDMDGISLSIPQMLKEHKLLPIEEALMELKSKYHFKMTNPVKTSIKTRK